MRGEFLASLGRPEQAAESFQAVIDGGADTPDQAYRRKLVDAMIDLEQFDDASAQLEVLGEDAADMTTTRLQHISIAMGRGNNEEALRLANELVTDRRDEARVWAARAQVLSGVDGRLEDAIEDLTEAVRLAPRDPAVLNLRAQLRYRSGDVEAALEDLQRGIELQPARTDLLTQGETLVESLADPERARRRRR